MTNTIPEIYILIAQSTGTLFTLLKQKSYFVNTVTTGAETVAWLRQMSYQILVIDTILPDMDSIEVIKQAKHYHPSIQVIIAASQPDVNNAIWAVKLGVTDYLLPPIDSFTLITAVEKALIKQKQKSRQPLIPVYAGMPESVPDVSDLSAFSEDSPDRYIFSPPLVLDLYTHFLMPCNSTTVLVQLSLIEVGLLRQLMIFAHQNISCRRLAQAVWDKPMSEETARFTIRPHIHRLRRKIYKLCHQTDLICTVRDQGYLYNGDVD